YIRACKIRATKDCMSLTLSGKGSRGVRASEWEGPDTKIEALVSHDVAEKIVDHVADAFFEHYAVIVYVQDAAVVRGEKYI
ncbi:MAG: P-II family nitrogen regulator, partial [Rhodothermales bacterium]